MYATIYISLALFIQKPCDLPTYPVLIEMDRSRLTFRVKRMKFITNKISDRSEEKGYFPSLRSERE